MASKIQFRRDTSNNWESINPVLAAGEIGYIFEKVGQEYKPTNQYKLGDGVKPWSELPLFGFSGNFSETLEEVEGEDSTTTVVSKRVLIDKFNSISDSILLLASVESLEELETEVRILQTTVGENKDNIATLQTTVGENKDNISTLQTTVGENKDNIATLQNKHQVFSKIEWGTGENAEEGVFYYIYEE